MADNELTDILDNLSVLVSQVKDFGQLSQIATGLGLQVPADVDTVRGIKNRIIQFLNGDVVETVPGVGELLTGLLERVNQFLYPDGFSDDEKDNEETEKPHVDHHKTHGFGRGLMNLGVGGGGGGGMCMPGRDHRRHSRIPVPVFRAVNPDDADDLGPVRRRSSSGSVASFVGRGRGTMPFRRPDSVHVTPGNAGRPVGRGRGALYSLGGVPSPAGVLPSVALNAHRLREFKIHGSIGVPP